MEIYNEFVRHHTEEILENKKKDPETIEELDRQLQYMEKSKAMLKQTTARNQAKTKQNIRERREENSSLIRTLEGVRDRKKALEAELNDNNLQIQKLKLAKQQMQREFDKKLSIVEQETLAKVR